MNNRVFLVVMASLFASQVANATISEVVGTSVADPTQGNVAILGLTTSHADGGVVDTSGLYGVSVYYGPAKLTTCLAYDWCAVSLPSGSSTAVAYDWAGSTMSVTYESSYPMYDDLAGASIRGYLQRSGGVTQHAITMEVVVVGSASTLSFSALGVLGGAKIGLINLVLKNTVTGKVIKSGNGALSATALAPGEYTVTATPVSVDAAGTALLIMGKQ